MTMHQVHLYFNTCMFSNVFVGCRIVQFTKKQINELKKIYEFPMIRKLGIENTLKVVRCWEIGVGYRSN